jgi:hypothetical protein
VKNDRVRWLAGGIVLVATSFANAAGDSATLNAAIRATRPIIDTRLRYEFVDEAVTVGYTSDTTMKLAGLR